MVHGPCARVPAAVKSGFRLLSDLVLAKVAVEGFEWRRFTALVVVVVHGSCEEHTVGVERNCRSLRKERRREGEEKRFSVERRREKGKGIWRLGREEKEKEGEKLGRIEKKRVKGGGNLTGIEEKP